MAGGPATLQIGAQSALGFVLQPTMGTPVAVPANSLNWVPQTANTLVYDTGQHLDDAGAGSEGSEQYGARGQSMEKGDFETWLLTEQCAALVAYFLGGADSKGTNYQVTTGGATGGNFTLTFNAQTTANIAYNATAAAVQAAMVAAFTTSPAVTNADVIVTGPAGGPWFVNFFGALAGTATALTGTFSGLTGGAGAVTSPGTTHNPSFANSPSRLTLQDQWTTQAYQVLDAYLDTLTLTSSKTDWKIKFAVKGGQGDTPIATTTPTFDSSDSTVLQWGDTSLANLHGSVAPGELEKFSLVISRNVQQFFGAGQYTPSQATGGKFSIKGSYSFTFASSAAATAYANTASGTEISLGLAIGPVTGAVAGSQHFIQLPNTRIQTVSKVYRLDGLFMVDAPFLVRKPTSMAWCIANGYSTAYI